MRYRTLGKTGLKVSVIGFGGIPIQRIPVHEVSPLLNKALDSGINFFDTARGYTDSEEKLGSVLKERRSESLIATKSMARTGEQMYADVIKSLQTMGVEYIDLYQLHNVKEKSELEQVLRPDGALAALKEAKREGLIKHIGITGHIKSILAEALSCEDFETVQFPFNAVEAKESNELLEMARKMNLGVIAMKPLAGGALRNTELALRFLLEYPVSTVIPGMDSEEQVFKNVLVGNSPAPLSANERKELGEEVEKLGSTFCRRCEYCQPCPQGVSPALVFLLDGYFTRYNLQGWARERYRSMPVRADQCIECGQCEERCPYNLPIRQMLREAEARLGS